MNIIDAIEAVNTAADQIRKDDPRLADDLDRASKTLDAAAAAIAAALRIVEGPNMPAGPARNQLIAVLASVKIGGAA